MKSILTTAALASSMMLAGQAIAAPMLWQNNSLTYLYGNDFKVDPDTQHTLTFEHASGWTYGDVFMFVDYKWNESTDDSEAARTYYGEFSPRLSLGKTTGMDLSYGPIKDVLIAFTYERGEDEVQNYLLGPAVDLAVPGFDRLAINTYYRKPDGIRDKASGQWQITPTWAITIPVGSSDILIDGYIDWVVNDAGNEGSDISSRKTCTSIRRLNTTSARLCIRKPVSYMSVSNMTTGQTSTASRTAALSAKTLSALPTRAPGTPS